MGSPTELSCYDASYPATVNVETPGIRTQCPDPHPRASAWIKTEAIRPCSQGRMGVEIPQSPAHAPVNRKRAAPSALAHADTRLCRATSARFAVQTPAQGSERSGLLCRRSGSRLGLHVTRGSSCRCVELGARGQAGHSCAARLLEKPSAQANGSTQPGGAAVRDSDLPPLPQIPLLPPLIPY